MATLAPQLPATRGGDRFFANLALLMCLVTAAGFVANVSFGRSTFNSPLLTHIHAVTFMGWLALFIVQSRLGVGESRQLHKTLGWVAGFWTIWMLVMGWIITMPMLQRVVTPFFFQPQLLMVGDQLNLIAFVAITWWAIAWRRRTDWHARLHIGAMAMLMPPGVGRLLPMPLLQPYALETAGVTALLFPLIGLARDRMKTGRVHPAWFVPFATMFLCMGVSRLIAFSPVGDAIYRAVVAGTPGEQVPGLAFGTPHP